MPSIKIVEIKGDQIKLGIEAPKTVKVYRQEIYQEIEQANRLALSSKERTHQTSFFAASVFPWSSAIT